jgi:hypothetical protein
MHSCGIFFTENLKGLWYSNLTSFNNEIIFLPLKEGIFNIEGVTKEKIGNDIDMYYIENKTYSNEFRFNIFYYINKLRDNYDRMFFNILYDFFTSLAIDYKAFDSLHLKNIEKIISQENILRTILRDSHPSTQISKKIDENIKIIAASLSKKLFDNVSNILNNNAREIIRSIFKTYKV